MPSPATGPDDLPPYHIRESARSRHVRLKVSAERGLEAIIPKGYDRTLIPDILASKRDWIARALQRIQAQVDCRSATRHLPDALSLPAIDRHWLICYLATETKPTVKLRSLASTSQPTESLVSAPLTSASQVLASQVLASQVLASQVLASLTSESLTSESLTSESLTSEQISCLLRPPSPPSPLREPGASSAQDPLANPLAPVEVLLVQGDRHDPATRAALCRWLKRYAKAILVPWLTQVSQECQLSYQRVQIRDQKTRWASCSSYQTIGLNYHLLFLPPTLVRYVLIHELCHTRELNHSPRFWSLVEQYEPNYRQCNEALKRAWRSLPGWSFETKV